MKQNAGRQFESIVLAFLEVLIKTRVRILADVEVDYLFAGNKDPGEVEDDAVAEDPGAHEHEPEVIIDRSRILQPEDEDVLGDNDGVQEHDDAGGDDHPREAQP